MTSHRPSLALRAFGAGVLLMTLAASGAWAQSQSFRGTTSQGKEIYLYFQAPRAGQPAIAYIYPYEYAMRCSGGKVRYRAGSFLADITRYDGSQLGFRVWDRDTRMTGEISVAADGQSATGSLVIAQPIIRNVGQTPEFVSRCTTGRVTFQVVPEEAAAVR